MITKLWVGKITIFVDRNRLKYSKASSDGNGIIQPIKCPKCDDILFWNFSFKEAYCIDCEYSSPSFKEGLKI